MVEFERVVRVVVDVHEGSGHVGQQLQLLLQRLADVVRVSVNVIQWLCSYVE